MADEILTDGFVTHTEPSLLNATESDMEKVAVKVSGGPAWARSQEEPHEGVQYFSFCHHKSAARVATLHMLITIFMDDSADMKSHAVHIFNSVRVIKAHLFTFSTLREQIFHQNKVSARGEIRKGKNVIEWAIQMKKLHASGDKDAGSVIKAWNADSSKQQQISGGKAVSLRTLPMPGHVDASCWGASYILE